MRKLFLILVWLICLANGFFFSDILINFFLGYSKSFISGATTGESQAYLSVVMLAVITLTLYLYTNLLTFKKQEKW